MNGAQPGDDVFGSCTGACAEYAVAASRAPATSTWCAPSAPTTIDYRTQDQITGTERYDRIMGNVLGIVLVFAAFYFRFLHDT